MKSWNHEKTVSKLLMLILILIFMSPVFANDQLIETALDVITVEQFETLKASLSNESDVTVNLCLGIAMHNLSGQDPEYIDDAIDHLKKAWKKSKNPLALAYWGSTKTISSGRTYDNGNMIGALLELNDGVLKIDRAVSIDTEDIGLRFLRILNGIDITHSSPISRKEKIEEDLNFISSHIDNLDSELNSAFWYATGELMLMDDEIDDALDAFEKAILADPDSPHAIRASDLMMELEE